MALPIRRSPRARLVLILVALASLIGGYYAGQYWQRRPLADLSAVVYPSGRAVVYPAAFGTDDTQQNWRLFLSADTQAPTCRVLLRHYATVFNRLAAWPTIQERLRLTVLAYDQPDPAAIAAFGGSVGWLEVLSAEPRQLDRLAAELGLLPLGGDWCSAHQASSVLVAPDRRAWALIPYESPAVMALNIRTIIEFVE